MFKNFLKFWKNLINRNSSELDRLEIILKGKNLNSVKKILKLIEKLIVKYQKKEILEFSILDKDNATFYLNRAGLLYVIKIFLEISILEYNDLHWHLDERTGFTECSSALLLISSDIKRFPTEEELKKWKKEVDNSKFNSKPCLEGYESCSNLHLDKKDNEVILKILNELEGILKKHDKSLAQSIFYIVDGEAVIESNSLGMLTMAAAFLRIILDKSKHNIINLNSLNIFNPNSDEIGLKFL